MALARILAALAGPVLGLGALATATAGATTEDGAADLLAIPANPLDDIAAVKNVDFAMRDGIVFKGPD